MMRARDQTKDQTYFLVNSTTPNWTSAFPPGWLHQKRGSSASQGRGPCGLADKKDSAGICFIGEDGHFREFEPVLAGPTRVKCS
ncbi:hypothetical protein ACW2AB_07220 [Limosilactobacillus fermentum]